MTTQASGDEAVGMPEPSQGQAEDPVVSLPQFSPVLPASLPFISSLFPSSSTLPSPIFVDFVIISISPSPSLRSDIIPMSDSVSSITPILSFPLA